MKMIDISTRKCVLIFKAIESKQKYDVLVDQGTHEYQF